MKLTRRSRNRHRTHELWDNAGRTEYQSVSFVQDSACRQLERIDVVMLATKNVYRLELTLAEARRLGAQLTSRVLEWDDEHGPTLGPEGVHRE